MRRLGIAAALLAVLSLILVWEIHRDAGKLLDLPGIVEDRLPPSPVETIPASQRAAADWIVIGAREEVKKAPATMPVIKLSVIRGEMSVLIGVHVLTW